MANRTWVGNAQTVQGSMVVTVGGTWAVNDTLTATINGKVATFVCTTTAAADAAAGLAQAVAALGSVEPEFNEIESAAANGAVVTFLFPSDGTPVTVTVARTTAASGTVAAVTNNPTGPEWWNNAANWLEGAVPVAADAITFGDLAQSDVRYGLPGAAVAYAKIEILGSFAGREIGLPSLNPNGYPEYRPQYLLTSCPAVSVGEGGGTGPALVKIDSGGVNCVLNVYSTDSGSDAGYAVHWKNTGASAALYRTSGTVKVAPRPGDSAALATVQSTADSSARGSVVAGGTNLSAVHLGTGAAVASLGTDGADVECWGSVGDAQVGSGTLTLAGAALITGTVTVHEDGVLKWNSSGTVNKVILDAGTLDTSGDPRPHTLAELDEYSGATVNDPDGTLIAGTWPVCKLIECGQDDVTHTVGQNVQVAYSFL